MKLDAGDQATCIRVNRPAPTIRFTKLLDSLANIPGLTIQSILFAGQLSNVTSQALQAWMNALAEIRPVQIQIYSTDRPVPQAGLEKIPPEGLQKIANQVETTLQMPVTAYWG
jgi:wyosine [tRNA(Phe)-imidazoG37] synthetase (radical SAM superfamily)